MLAKGIVTGGDAHLLREVYVLLVPSPNSVRAHTACVE